MSNPPCVDCILPKQRHYVSHCTSLGFATICLPNRDPGYQLMRHDPHRRCRTQNGSSVFRRGTMSMQQWIEGSTAWQDSSVHFQPGAPLDQKSSRECILTTNFICQIRIRDDPSQPCVSNCSETSSHSWNVVQVLQFMMAQHFMSSGQATKAKENCGLRMLKIFQLISCTTATSAASEPHTAHFT